MTDLEKQVMAHRYLYYVEGVQVISDYQYDKLEKEALMEVDEDSPLHSAGSDLASSYSDSIKVLAETYIN